MEPMGPSQTQHYVWSSSRHVVAPVGDRTVLTGSELYTILTLVKSLHILILTHIIY